MAGKNGKEHSLRKYYYCLYHCNSDKLKIVCYFNNLLGIQNSSNIVTLTKQHLITIYNCILPHIDTLRDIFKMRSDKNNYPDKVAINHLNYVYREWCNCLFVRERHRECRDDLVYDASIYKNQTTNLCYFIRKYT